MQWIIDLLIDKLKKDKTKEWEPEPLWIEDFDDDPYEPITKKNKEKDKANEVIIIDL